MVNGAICCFNLGGILCDLLIQPYILDGEWIFCCFNHNTLVANGAICCFNHKTLVANGTICFNHKTLVVNGAICCFNLNSLVMNWAICYFNLGGEWFFLLFQPWW